MSFYSYTQFLPNLIDRQLNNIHQRQTAILLIQLILMGFGLWLVALATGVPLLTYLAGEFLTQQAAVTAFIMGVSLLMGVSAVLDLKPIYIDKIKAIDAFVMASDKIAFIKKEVSDLSKKAGVTEPDICFDAKATDVNAKYDYGIFKNGKIIFTAGFLRSFGMGGLTERDVRATIAHELGHKISRDLFYLNLQILILVLTASIQISAMVDIAALWWATPLMTLATILPPVLLGVGLLFWVPLSYELFLKYRQNMETAADVKGAELTNDIEGMSNKNISSQEKKLNFLRMLSFLDVKQVGLYIKSLAKLKIPATVEKLKNILLEKISYRKKRRKLINSSLLDKDWEMKLAGPTSHFIMSQRDSLNERSDQELAATGLLTRFNNFVQAAVNPYPSEETRMREVHTHFAGKSGKSSPA